MRNQSRIPEDFAWLHECKTYPKTTESHRIWNVGTPSLVAVVREIGVSFEKRTITTVIAKSKPTTKPTKHKIASKEGSDLGIHTKRSIPKELEMSI